MEMTAYGARSDGGSIAVLTCKDDEGNGYLVGCEARYGYDIAQAIQEANEEEDLPRVYVEDWQILGYAE